MDSEMRMKIHEAMSRIRRQRGEAPNRNRGRVQQRRQEAPPARQGGLSKGMECEALIGADGKFRKCVVTKIPKHRRWVDVYCDVSKSKVKRVPVGLLRQVSDDGAHDVEVEGGAPVLSSGMQRQFIAAKGMEVEAKIGADGKYRRGVVTRMPKHRRWVDVYCDVSKSKVKRVPMRLLRQVSDDGAHDVEVEGGAPVLSSGMQRPLRIKKGVELEAKIGCGGKFRVATVVKMPKHRRWVNVYCDVTKTLHKRIPVGLLRQKSDDVADDVEYDVEAYPQLPASMSIKQAMFPKKGQEVEVNTDGSWERAQVTKVPKHRRWFNVYLDDAKMALTRVPKSQIRELEEEEDLSSLMNQLKPDHMPAHAYNPDDRERSFRFEAYRSNKAGAIKDAMRRIMARRQGMGTYEDPEEYPEEFEEEGFQAMKGVEVEAKIGSDGVKYRRAVIVKVPKHRRWAHVYDDVEKRTIKRVPMSLIRQRSDDEDQPEDLELE